MQDSKARSLIKSLSWRLIATLTTMVISYVVTTHVLFAVKIGAAELVFKLLLYYIHERLWENPFKKAIL